MAAYLVALGLHLQRTRARVTLEAAEVPEVLAADDEEVHVVDGLAAADARRGHGHVVMLAYKKVN